MFDIEYAIMYHSPSYVSIDRITLAILFFNKQTKETHLSKTKNWKRVSLFNDELEIELIKLQLDGINSEIHDIAKSPDFSLEKYTKFYVNELRFTNVISTSVDDFNFFIKECSRQYMPQDYEKSKRPSTVEQLSFIRKYLKVQEVVCSPNKIIGHFNENITFDFIINDYAFKLFRFEGREQTRLISSVKDWAYNAIKLKNKYKIIFITDKDFAEPENYKILYKILDEESYKIINFSQVIEFIQSIA
ncbi:hypothetical protein FC959_04700 [Clostridium botulinum]|nr:hypothetical protein [Clostridium botulinum]